MYTGGNATVKERALMVVGLLVYTRVYARVLAADVTVEKREKPVQRRITLLREGKRGEELLQRLQALAEE